MLGTVQHVPYKQRLWQVIHQRHENFEASLAERLPDQHRKNDDFTVFYWQDDVPDSRSRNSAPPDVEYGNILQPDRPEIDGVEIETHGKNIGAKL